MYTLTADEGFQTIITRHETRVEAIHHANCVYAVEPARWNGQSGPVWSTTRDGLTVKIEEAGRGTVYRYVVEVEVPTDLPPRVRLQLDDATRLGSLVTRALTSDQQLPWGVVSSVSRLSRWCSDQPDQV